VNFSKINNRRRVLLSSIDLRVLDSRVELGHLRGCGAFSVRRRVRRVAGSGHFARQSRRPRVTGDQLVRRHGHLSMRKYRQPESVSTINDHHLTDCSATTSSMPNRLSVPVSAHDPRRQCPLLNDSRVDDSVLRDPVTHDLVFDDSILHDPGSITLARSRPNVLSGARCEYVWILGCCENRSTSYTRTTAYPWS